MWDHIVNGVGTLVYWLNELQTYAAAGASATAAGLEWNINQYIFQNPLSSLSEGGDWGGWGVLDDASLEFSTDGGGFCVNPLDC